MTLSTTVLLLHETQDTQTQADAIAATRYTRQQHHHAHSQQRFTPPHPCRPHRTLAAAATASFGLGTQQPCGEKTPERMNPLTLQRSDNKPSRHQKQKRSHFPHVLGHHHDHRMTHTKPGRATKSIETRDTKCKVAASTASIVSATD
jgi:hypothetical protein